LSEDVVRLCGSSAHSAAVCLPRRKTTDVEMPKMVVMAAHEIGFVTFEKNLDEAFASMLR